jgi:hypothetical protein
MSSDSSTTQLQIFESGEDDEDDDDDDDDDDDADENAEAEYVLTIVADSLLSDVSNNTHLSRCSSFNRGTESILTAIPLEFELDS